MLFTYTQAKANTQKFDCLAASIDKIKKLNEYTVRMRKIEYFGSQRIDEEILVYENKTAGLRTLEFINQGSTGIKNNGMKLSYNVNDNFISIKYGKSFGLGVFASPFIKILGKTKTHLYDADVVDKQIFTLNRAGLSFLYKVLENKFIRLKNEEIGKFDETISPEKCSYEFRKKHKEPITETVSKDNTLTQIEEKYGTLAYLLYLENSKEIKTFHEFLGSENIKIFVTDHFTNFNLVIDNVTKLPLEFTLFHNDDVIGKYQFEDINVF